MPYCEKCGTKVSESDRYCPSCGRQLLFYDSIVEYTGIIYKCPNCGEIIPSFTANCPSCGLELRDRKPSTSSIGQFVEALNSMGRGVRGAKKKAKFIRSYKVSDSKEDILEFLSYASAGINTHLLSKYTSADAGMKGSGFKAQRIITAAWIDKFDEMYHKAQLLFPNDPVMVQVQMIADQKRRDMDEARKSIRRGKAVSCLGVVFVMLLGVALTVGLFYGMFALMFSLAKQS